MKNYITGLFTGTDKPTEPLRKLVGLVFCHLPLTISRHDIPLVNQKGILKSMEYLLKRDILHFRSFLGPFWGFYACALCHPLEKPSIFHPNNNYYTEFLVTLWTCKYKLFSKNAEYCEFLSHLLGFSCYGLCCPLRYILHFVSTKSPSGIEYLVKICSYNFKPFFWVIAVCLFHGFSGSISLDWAWGKKNTKSTF